MFQLEDRTCQLHSSTGPLQFHSIQFIVTEDGEHWGIPTVIITTNNSNTVTLTFKHLWSKQVALNTHPFNSVDKILIFKNDPWNLQHFHIINLVKHLNQSLQSLYCFCIPVSGAIPFWMKQDLCNGYTSHGTFQQLTLW
jgi:hypothetical protein